MVTGRFANVVVRFANVLCRSAKKRNEHCACICFALSAMIKKLPYIRIYTTLPLSATASSCLNGETAKLSRYPKPTNHVAHNHSTTGQPSTTRHSVVTYAWKTRKKKALRGPARGLSVLKPIHTTQPLSKLIIHLSLPLERFRITLTSKANLKCHWNVSSTDLVTIFDAILTSR